MLTLGHCCDEAEIDLQALSVIIPEPSTLALLMIGCLWLGRRPRR